MRDDFSKPTIRTLGERAAFICSNPDCKAMTLGPSSEADDKIIYFWRAAHICGASTQWPRYNKNMSTEERKAISNAIYLCCNCADMIDDNKWLDFKVSILLKWKEDHEKWVRSSLNKMGSKEGYWGKGGDANVNYNTGTIITGKGGKWGIGGPGGDWGGATVEKNDGIIITGDGGNSAQPDGSGGRGAKGSTEKFGFPTYSWGYGQGGDWVNTPEYDRRLELLKTIRINYLEKFPNRVPYIEAGIDNIPIDWINQSLVELTEDWSVLMWEEGYILPALEKNE